MKQEILYGIIDAPFAAKPWRSLFDALDKLSGGTRSMIKFVRTDDPGVSFIRTSEDEVNSGIVDLYRQVYQFKDPLNYDVLRRGQLYGFHHLIDQNALKTSEYYRELCVPFGMTHAFFAYLGRFDGIDAWLNGARDHRFTDKEWRGLSEALPFISTAAGHHCRLERHRTQTMTYADAIGRIGVGIILLDEDGRIIEMNSEARRIVERERLAAPTEDRLLLPPKAARELIAMLRGIRCGNPGSPASLLFNGCAGKTWSLKMVPLIDRGRIGIGAAAVLYLQSPRQINHARALETIKNFHNLTPSEARVALLLAEGLSLDDIADKLGVTINSVRTYCKRAFLKTGTKRQAELVRLVINSMSLVVDAE